MKLCTSTISIGISRDHTNLPVVHDLFVTKKAKWALGVRMHSGLCHSCLLSWTSLAILINSF
jgi:hypothetical protein